MIEADKKIIEGKMVLHITISGESAEELFAVGPEDLKNYFLKEYLNVDPDDIKHISFNKRKEADNPFGVVTVHKDNF